MSWVHEGTTYYGHGTNFTGLANPQPKDEGTCWARVLSSLLGLDNWGVIASYAALDDIKEGQLIQRTRELLESVRRDFQNEDKSKRPYLPKEIARWFGPDWSTTKCEETYPVAVALDVHWVIVLGIAYDAQNKPASVCFWDTDTNIKYVSYQEFMKRKPEAGVVRVAR